MTSLTRNKHTYLSKKQKRAKHTKETLAYIQACFIISSNKTKTQMHGHFKCMTYPLLTLQQHNTYGIMHEHVNACSWHSKLRQTLIKTCDRKQACERGKQEPIEPKTCEKLAKQNKHVKAKTKQTNKNLGLLGNDIMHARTSLRTHNQACVCRQDYVYARLYVHKSLPRKPKNEKNRAQARKT